MFVQYSAVSSGARLLGASPSARYWGASAERLTFTETWCFQTCGTNAEVWKLNRIKGIIQLLLSEHKAKVFIQARLTSVQWTVLLCNTWSVCHGHHPAETDDGWTGLLLVSSDIRQNLPLMRTGNWFPGVTCLNIYKLLMVVVKNVFQFE